MEITVDSLIGDVLRLPELVDIAPYLITGQCDLPVEVLATMRFSDVNRLVPEWEAESMVYGLNRLAEARRAGSGQIIPVYSEQEIQDDPELAQVALVHYPGRQGWPFVIVIAGGAYNFVCSLVEGFPIAARFSELGYHAFVFNYRTGGPGLMPKPLDDLAAAVRLLNQNAGDLGMAERHAVCGFSAGAHLTCLWATDNKGFRNYDLPSPEMLMPVYPVFSAKHSNPERSEQFLLTALGPPLSEERFAEWDVERHTDDACPPCYIVACRDDPTVPFGNSVVLHETLTDLGVPSQLELGGRGGHGFGLGLHTDVAGWVDRSVGFWRQQFDTPMP